MRRGPELLLAVCLFLIVASLPACQSTVCNGPIRFRITLAREVARKATTGRMFVFMTDSPQERQSISVGFIPANTWIAAMEVTDFAPGQTLEFNPDLKAFPHAFSHAKPGAYQIMALLDTDRSFAYSGQNEGDLCSPVIKIGNLIPADGGPVELVLNRRTESAVKVADTENIKLVEFQSSLLTAFWQRPVMMRAGVVLPPSYHNTQGESYPALYRIHGFAGDHTAAWQEGEELSQAMREGREVELIHVFLDGSFPTGHHLFAD